ncbi:Rieske 2Fe-2S domain-containing protein [Streptomyces sp. SID5785]|uniref:Rieske (2Fe-2S) protein n=1 Tax=Streptomyces sp. SID5785 TaxID=2690309 RepID=UPI0013611800|nr:Rieske (2Fe-2S) protein [Streptomyces sp. SID5785]MZD09734.1 Rieske 2Fe-2S domain-containing protein [Streptomyces sp. SID5785]
MTASQESAPPGAAPTRRAVVATVGATGIAMALGACGGSDDGPSEPAGNTSAATSRSGGDQAGQELVKTSEVPEGGGKILTDAGVVVTQPQKGRFKAFTDICTHRQCQVSSVEGGTINCPCHGSRYSIEDGSVRHGPATQPLAEKKITTSGGVISLA